MEEQAKKQLKRFILFHVVIITILLAFTLLAHIIGFNPILKKYHNSLTLTVGVTYFLIAFLTYTIRWIKKIWMYFAAIIFIEVSFSAFLIYITGGGESFFTVFFFVNILSSSIVLMARSLPLSTAALSSVYLIIIILVQYHNFHHTQGLAFIIEEEFFNENFFRILLHVSGYFALAGFIVWYLDQLKRVHGALKIAEINIDELENFNRNIVASLSSGLVTIDKTGRIIFFNQGAERITGYSFEEVNNRPVEEIFPHLKDIDLTELDTELLENRYEFSKKSKDGQDMVLGYNFSPLSDRNGNLQGIIINFQDITKVKKMEERILIEDRIATLARENIQLKKELKNKYNFDNIIGISDEMTNIFNLIQQVADTRSNLLISGESGTGKELVARAIHYNSSRKDKQFIDVNCSAIPENLIESELFGHRKGAFTGAVQNKMGLFKAADQGTIFLDEVGELPLALQVKLLRVIQERSFREVGGTNDINVNVRIIAATNKELEKEVATGNFRQDLYYRLNVIQINLPPLRSRRDDIPLLAQHFLEKFKKELNKDLIKKISADAMQYLMKYDYPGNVRELENIIERAVALEKSEVILAESLPAELTRTVAETKSQEFLTGKSIEIPHEGLDLEKLIGDIEKDILINALKKTNGVKKNAAKLLNISFRSLRYRLLKYDIN